jgi:hypothetical protein
MDKKQFEYAINDKLYIQRPLVLGQIGQVTELVRDVEIPENIGSHDLITLLGNKLPAATAILLSPPGTKIKDKDMSALTEEFREHMDIETAMEVMDHFLSLNPIASVIEKLTGMMTAVKKAMTGSKEPLSFSPEGTLQNGTGSSGDTPRKSASLTSRKDPAGGSSARE